jgi:hypothetical protein
LVDSQAQYIVKTNDPEEAQAMIDALHMRDLIQTAYDEILRPYLKYAELTREEEDILENVKDKLLRHFRKFLE